MKKIENIRDLRDDLIQLYENLKDKKIGLKEVKELTNTAGKIMNSAKLELEYRSFVGNKEEILFLKTYEENKSTAEDILKTH
jgi:hypothetical protein